MFNKILTAAAAVTLTLGMAQTSDAREFAFSNGNLEGQFFVIGGTNRDGNQTTSFPAGNKVNIPAGFFLRASRSSTTAASGWRCQSNKTFGSGATNCHARVDNAPGSTDQRRRNNAWAAYWIWDTNANGLEIDIIECGPNDGTWNAYVAAGQNSAPLASKLANTTRIVPLAWRYPNAVWGVTWNGNSATFDYNGGNRHTRNYTQARPNRAGRIRYSQRPWAFGGNPFANGTFGNFVVDRLFYPGT